MLANIRRFSLIVILSLPALPAAAQWYVGASAGRSSASFRGESPADQLIDLGFDTASTSVDDSDTMYRLYGGWRFHRFLALELAYVDLGRFRLHSDVSPPGTLDTSVKSDGGEVSLVGMWPVWSDRLSLLGRVGAYATRVRASYGGSGSVQLIDGNSEQSHRSTELTYGIGVLFDITPKLGLRAEWSRYDRVGTQLTGGQFDARVWSAGAQWRF